MLLSPDQFHGTVCGSPVRPFALVVLLHAALWIIADADVVGVVGAEEDIAEEHCPSTRPARNPASSLRTNFGSAKVWWRRGESNPRPRRPVA